MVIPLWAICCLLSNTGISQEPAFRLFYLLFRFFLRRGAWCFAAPSLRLARVNESHVWWRAAASVTQYTHGGTAPEIHLLTLAGGKQQSLNCCLHLSVTLFCSPVHLWVQSVGTPQIPVISPLKKCGMGPTSTRVATLFWCYGSLLHSDTKRRGVAQSSYCFRCVSMNASLTTAAAFKK